MKKGDYSTFEKNYTGILNPKVAYAQAVARAEVEEGKFKNATYSPAANRRLEQEHIKNARPK